MSDAHDPADAGMDNPPEPRGCPIPGACACMDENRMLREALEQIAKSNWQGLWVQIARTALGKKP